MEKELEKKLVKRAARGDDEAFEAIITHYETRIYQVCLRMCANSDDAMDMAQEAAIRIWKSIAGFSYQSALFTWIYRITVNVCLDFLRRNKSTISIDELGESGYSPSAPEGEEPEATALSKEKLGEIANALRHLPEDQRIAVILRDVQSLSYEEVTQILGSNMNTTKSRISRGRRSLRRLLSGEMQLFPNTHVKESEV